VERPSRRLGLLDKAVAYDFDMAVEMAVFHYEEKREEVRLDAMSMGALSRARADAFGESQFFGSEAEAYLNQSSQSLGDI
jgi:hypothetical protein